MNKKITYLHEYTPPAYLIPSSILKVELDPNATRVEAQLHCQLNPAYPGAKPPLLFNGEQLELEQIGINGMPLQVDEYQFENNLLTIFSPPDSPFTVETVVSINPAANTELEGLYLSAGNYCTQCEAEGFRKITFFPDRPDVMSVFTTTVIGDTTSCPVLLSNGNLHESGKLEGGRHFATWHDPFPKPSYLFALVAGDLVRISDSFTTNSGREVALHIYVEARNQKKCGHAMQALKKAMRWDEERFGREYDLDNYMILAVDDFNMGAMENKGLNVFNSKYVLALPETATDTDYEGIEAVIAHEYFHNWTGNRITCRDWFQLSLKEGLTVFRDQEFTADIVSRPVKRIHDANIIRSLQFREDSGPMAHPVRPASFVEINNFYTLTVYNKGAEVIRMLHTILGEAAFRRGMDIYFERHDGQAVTCDDFIAAMEHASGLDLTRFKRWYTQAGTPELEVKSSYDATMQHLTLNVRQSCPATPDMPPEVEKQPFTMPLSLGLLDIDGRDLTFTHAGRSGKSAVLLLTEAEQTFVLEDVCTPPVLSLLRNFSAPVRLRLEQSEEELALRMAHDSDPFNRWDAGQQLALNALLQQIERYQQGQDITLPASLLRGMRALLEDHEAEHAFLSEALLLPTENWIGQQIAPLDPEAVFSVRQQLRALLGKELRQLLVLRYQALAMNGSYRYTPAGAGQRALRNTCLSYLLCPDLDGTVESELLQLGEQQYEQANNMTDTMAALGAVVNADRIAGDALLADFLAKWQHDPLVMDKWLSIQAACPLPGTLARVRQLLDHPVFSLTNPNKVRALIASFCSLNHNQFHHADGSGYAFLGEQVLKLDTINPQIAARMAAPLSQWRRYDQTRQQLMVAQLERISAQATLSDDLKELVEKSLQGQ
ncbi:MAG: aminopeptidase N [Desulfobulbaceae bacterium]|nr:aminopeptidase N [Desulfobulbaceae bacterium]